MCAFLDHPWPPLTGDRQRIRWMLHRLRLADVSLFLTPPVGHPPFETDLPTREVPRRRSSGTAAARALVGTFAGRPPMMAFYRQASTRRAFRDWVKECGPDVVLTHHLGGAGLVDGIVDPGRVVLDLPNFEIDRFDRLARIAKGAVRARWRAERIASERWARRMLHRYGAVVVTSEIDAEAYRSLAPAANLVVAPNGAELRPTRRVDPGGASLLFVGDMSYEPNADAVRWFSSEVLPLLPEVDELRVAGRGRGAPATRVRYLGFVEELLDEIDRAAALVVPLRAGGGTRLKVLEAFASGLPVVSSSIGIEGIHAVSGTHFLRADTPSEWADSIRQALHDAGLRARLADSGRDLVSDRYTWEEALSPLAAAVMAVGSGRR